MNPGTKRRAGCARTREHGDHISERVEFFDMFWGPNLRSYIFRGNLRYFPTQNWFGFWFWYLFSIFNISLKKVSSSRPNPPSGGGRMLTGKKRGNSDPRRSTRQTAVHYAADGDNVEGVRLLLADPRLDTANHEDDEGYTPVMAAVFCNKVNALRELVAHPSVLLDVRDRDGMSLEDVARLFFAINTK